MVARMLYRLVVTCDPPLSGTSQGVSFKPCTVIPSSRSGLSQSCTNHLWPLGDRFVTGSERLTQGGNENLIHPANWFLRCGGTDAEGGGWDGVGGFAQAGREYPGTGMGDRAFAEHSAALLPVERLLGAQAGDEARWKFDDFKDYIGGRMRTASPAKIPAAVLFREIEERGYRGRRDASEAVRAHATSGASG